MNSALFARLVAQVEDAGPGAMRVLQPLGLKPSQYVKMAADPGMNDAWHRACQTYRGRR